MYIKSLDDTNISTFCEEFVFSKYEFYDSIYEFGDFFQ